MKKPLHPYLRFLVRLREQNLLRRLPGDKRYKHDFANNDYLGFSKHPLLIQAAREATYHSGVGNPASRLISSHQLALTALEESIAMAKKSPSALIFATGYQANVAVLSALLNSKVLEAPPLVFSDRLNHASMHVGCQIAKVKQFRYRHGDYDHLHFLLKKTKALQQPKFILTESVFGMDGDVADIARLLRLAKDYQALLYVDEAHATGLFGKTGYGICSDYEGEVDVCMGTFSKALGVSGAYVCSSTVLKRYFINRASGLIYSTAISPIQVAIMQKAWELVGLQQKQVAILLQQAALVRLTLQKQGFNIGNSTTHIIPVILKSPQKVLAAKQFLAEKGINVSAIRPPSVAENQSRLRIALTTQHTAEDINALLHAMRALIPCDSSSRNL